MHLFLLMTILALLGLSLSHLRVTPFSVFRKFAKIVQKEKDLKIKSIRSDHGGEFQNESFEKFCENHGISHNFSAPRTPQ